MHADVTPYLDLATSEHRSRPNFIATLTLLLQPLADQLDLLRSIPAAYDLDTSVGAQEDVVGEWVGISRQVTEPLTGVYFAFDDASVGFDLGSWYGPFDPTAGIVDLADGPYRTLLRFQIQANTWNGTVQDSDRAYKQFFRAFPPEAFEVLVQDHGDMSMALAVFGGTPDALTLALIRSHPVRPAGVRFDAIITQTVADTPFFGFDAATDAVGGFDTGAWGALQYP